jgi:glycine/D-amino acid oxidase-like deaminating enzyme
VGKIVADLVTRGLTPIDMDGLRLSRFATADALSA